MKTTIYHFSATGNSLSLARDLAKRLEDTRLVAIADAIGKPSAPDSNERIGFVFPVFAWGLPRIVADFVEGLRIAGSPRIFAVATCVAIPGNTLRELERLLRRKGLGLRAGFVVGAVRSSLMKLNGFDRVMIALEGSRIPLASAQTRLDEIVRTIEEDGIHRPETSSRLANAVGSLIHGLALRSFRTIDAGFEVGDSCKGCGTCARVCPRANIEIRKQRPTFRHDCEFCHACIQWCPSFAIRHPGFDESPRQYRHPDIMLVDLARGSSPTKIATEAA